MGHGHHHPPTSASSAEGPLAPSPEASVVLDIGPHAGALVLYASEDLAGEEIEIRPGWGAWLGTHTAIRERHAGGQVLYAGVFGSLAEDTYDLRLRGGTPGSCNLPGCNLPGCNLPGCNLPGCNLTVDVVAGTVTEVTLLSSSLLSSGARP